ncbi:acyltransferase [Marinobacter koreensis]|uniref:Acyltransferase n=1 Tax=Marinobacter koreensis TaxID=335974 RepID=A0ABW0RHC3_9GAMM|nr:acyltransferase [Marinobacter koreensis]MCK7548603.1 acyltransferase [Marinobacter koreensis]
MNIRHGIKRTVKTAFLIVVAPLYVLYRMLSLFGSKDGTFQSFSQLISLIPGKTGIYIRAAFYRFACIDTSDDISIGFLTIFSHADTTIMKGVYVGPQCNIGKCTIGQNTLIGSGVHILSGRNQHKYTDLQTPIKEQGGYFEKICIGDDCWIGNNSTILKSVGPQCIIAAASLIIDETGSQEILGGNPAKTLRYRSN